MNNADKTKFATRFSLRSLLQPIVLAVLVLVAFIQYQQNEQLQRRLEALSSRVEHLNASDDLTKVKLDALRSAVSDEPILSVEDYLTGRDADQAAGVIR